MQNVYCYRIWEKERPMGAPGRKNPVPPRKWTEIWAPLGGALFPVTRRAPMGRSSSGGRSFRGRSFSGGRIFQGRSLFRGRKKPVPSQKHHENERNKERPEMRATKSPPKWTGKRATLGALFFRVAPGGSLIKMYRKILRFCSEPWKTHGQKNPHENEPKEERPKRALFFRGAPGVALFPIYGINCLMVLKNAQLPRDIRIQKLRIHTQITIFVWFAGSNYAYKYT